MTFGGEMQSDWDRLTVLCNFPVMRGKQTSKEGENTAYDAENGLHLFHVLSNFPVRVSICNLLLIAEVKLTFFILFTASHKGK